MKKKVFSLMMTLLLAFVGVARADVVTIGDPTSTTTNSYLPGYTLYDYAISQQIYTADEIGVGGTINTLTMWLKNSSSYARNINVYMKEVSESTFASNTSWVSMTADDMVASFTMDNGVSSPVETEITLTTPFSYSGTGNLVICFQDVTGSWSSGLGGVEMDANGNQAIYAYRDGTVYDVSNPGVNGTLLAKKNVVALDITSGAGGQVVDVTIGDPTSTTTNSYLPGYTLYDYAISQQIYTADEIGVGGTINTLTMWLKNSSSYARNINVYMKEVSESTFASNTSWVSMTADDMVASFTMDNGVSSPVETEITLTTPFSYSGTGNLVICFQDVTGQWSSGLGGVEMDANGNQAIYAYRDGTVYDASNPGVTGTLLAKKNVVRLSITTGGAPALIPITEVYINDFVEPVWGQPVAQEVTLPEDANYTLLDYGWFSYPHGMFPGREMNPDPIYNLSDRDYVWGFNLLPNEGYAFSPALEAYINGSADNVFIALIVTPDMAQEFPEFPAGSVMIYTYAYYTYEEGLHTLSTYGVGDNAYESIDRLLIERPNGAWMEPYHFQLYNDGEEDVEVVLIDFLHNNGYFSMAEGTEYPITVAATGRPGVDLYINTNTEWTDTEEINSLLAVNTSERSTHLYQIIAAPYTPYCPDVVETAYPITNITAGQSWSMWTSEMWNEANQAAPYELHNNYTLPFPEIPEGYDAVMTFTLDHDMMLSASVSDGECDGDEVNGKVALYPADFNGQAGPMADNYYDGRPMSSGGGSTPGAYTSINFETGNFSQFSNYTNNSAYPWVVAAEAAHGGSFGMMSGNAGVASSNSSISTTVNYSAAGTVSFDYNARGEGSSTAWDKCIFQIDGVEQFRYGAVNAWNNFSANVAAGQHTFTWIYEKDSSINPTGDCFYVDNIVFNGGRIVGEADRELVSIDDGGYNAVAIPCNFIWNYNENQMILTADEIGMNGSITSVAYKRYSEGSGSPATRDLDIYMVHTSMDSYASTADWIPVTPADLVFSGEYTFETTGTDWQTITLDTPFEYNGTDNLCICIDDNTGTTTSRIYWSAHYTTPSNRSMRAWSAANNFDPTQAGVPVGGSSLTGNWAADIQLNIDDQLVPIDPDHEHAYTAGPVIEGLNVLAGTYYLVASSTCEDFEVSIDFEELPCPIEAVTGIYPADNASDIATNNLTLRWTLDDYCNEYRLVFGSTYYPDDEPNHPATYIGEWSSDLAESFRITDVVTLWNNTNYFWRIDQRSNPGTPYECVTMGPVFGFTTHLNAPTNLQATNTRIFEYEETVTLSWTPIQDRTYRRYRIYMDGEMIYQTPNNQVVTSYNIPQNLLTYNMDENHGYIFEVTAVYDEGESPMSNPVEIWVSGNGSVSGTVYEQDETTPIGGVTVTIIGTNEFGQTENYTFTTNAQGYYEGNVHAGTYGYAVATMAGYQSAETIHPLPFDVIYDEETEDVDFIMDELFIAPAHVCAQTTYVEGVEGDSLVQVWWDFNFFTTLTENFENWDNTPYAWQNDATYPWTLTTEAHEGTYAFKSGNAGVHSSTSTLEVTVDIPQDGQFSFDLWARGESTTDTYDWDVCRFFFDGQQMFQYGQHSGWETYSMPITAGSHTFRWVYKKDSSVHPSAGDCFIIDNIVFVGHADRAERSLHHYNIYRTDCYNDGPYNSDNTTFLASAWRPDTSYFDVQWPQVPVGVYKYGVSAVYAGNYDGNPNNPRIDYPFEPRESEIVWHNMCSPCIDKDMYLENEVTVNVVLNSADSPEGVQVSFENLNPGEQFNHPQAGVTLDQTGYYVFPRFRKGDYLVTVGLPGYETIQVTESIWEPRDLRYVLIEIICKVQNLYVSRTGWAMWDPQEPCPGGATPGPTPGGNTTFTEGFEGGLNGWNVLTVNANGGSWIHSDNNLGGYDYTTLAHGGTGFAMCYSFVDYVGSFDTDSYLYSPQKYDIVNGSTLTFWADNANDTYPESFSVCVSTADSPTASSFTQVWSGAAKGEGNAKSNNRHEANRYENWRSHSVDLSAYAGQSVYIAFHDVNYDQYEVWIDDVALTTGRAVAEERHLEGYKIMCTSIDGEPIFNHNTVAEQPFCQLATDQLVEGETYVCKVAAIYSTGMSEYESVTWQYEFCENYAGTLNGLTAEGSTVSWDYPGGQPGPGPDPGQGSTFTVGFEGGLPAGWTVNDANNDGYTWCATSAIPSTWTYYAGMSLDWYHSGSDAMCSGSYINGVGAITPDEYLISPQVTLAAGSQLSFWVAATDASYPADHFGVFVSTTGTNPSDFTSVQEWTLAGKSGGNGNADVRVRSTIGRDNRATRLGTWYNYTVDLSAYAGQAYIAFRHFNCNDQYIMCLDDVELGTGRNDRAPWDLITNLSMTSAGQQAIATDGQFIYTGSWQGTPTGGNRFHKYTLDGTHVEGFEINGLNSVGVRDFTFDGQYFYCGASSSTLYCIDLANQTLVGQTTTNCSAIRHCSYDPERDGFWMGDWSTLALYSRNGALIQSAPAPTSAYGSAYYKDANNVEHLYLFCQPSSDCHVYDYNITTNTLSSTPIFSITGTNAECSGIAGGAFIGEYQGMTAFFGNCQQDPNLVAIYELAAAPTPPTPPTPAEGILGAMIFVDGEWEAFVEYPTNTYTYEGDGQEICVRMVYDGTAELPSNNFYYTMSCEECIGGLEPVCEPGAPIYGEITADDQVRVYWSEPVPPIPGEGDTFEYDFENGSLDGLTLIDNDGDGYNWLANTSFGGHNGSTGIIYSQSYDNNFGALTPDNYIVFPQSNIANGSTFSFWACGQDASWASEHFGVAVSTTGTNASDFTTIAEWTMTAKGTKAVRDGRDQGNWYNYTVDLSDYAGMPVYIAIRHFNSTDMFYLDVDDVMLGIANKGNRDGIIGYNIYRSEDNVDYALVGSVPGTATEYIDNPGEGTFYYQVTAVYANCESEPAISGENPDVNYVMIGRTGIGENSANVNLFPNPTKGNVTIQAVNMHRITVVSVLGQVVFDTELDQDEYILNMSKFNTGMYMVRVYTDEGVTVKRVTVLH